MPVPQERRPVSAPGEAGEPPDPASRAAISAYVLPLAAAALLSSKVLLVTRDPETALSVLQGLSLQAILSGLVVVSLPVASILAMALLLVHGSNKPERVPALVALVLVLFGFSAFVPVSGTTATATAKFVFLVLVAGGVGCWFMPRERRGAKGVRVAFYLWLHRPLLVLGATAVAVALSGGSVWLSPQKVTRSDPGLPPFVAYQLSSGDGWDVYLDDASRLVSHVRSETIAAKENCRLDRDVTSITLWQHWGLRGTGSPLPACR